jgi:hypothetical protein
MVKTQINVENAAKEFTSEDLMDRKVQTVTEEQKRETADVQWQDKSKL